jgi:hypothetical protein
MSYAEEYAQLIGLLANRKEAVRAVCRKLKATVHAGYLAHESPGGRCYITVPGNPDHDARDSHAMLAPRPLLVQLGKTDH